MLTINEKGGIQLSISHLLEDPPSDFAGILNRYKDRAISLFHHVVSSPECAYEKRFGLGRVPGGILAMTAEQRMKQILRDGVIVGNPKGYFVNKHHGSLSASQLEVIKSVSFTFCESEELVRHFEARCSDFGICFFHDFLQSAGMSPVVYLNDLDTGLE